MTLKLKRVGIDSWDRPVYIDEKNRFFVDTDNLERFAEHGTIYKAKEYDEVSQYADFYHFHFETLHTKSNNEFDGEPDCPLKGGVEIEFI